MTTKTLLAWHKFMPSVLQHFSDGKAYSMNEIAPKVLAEFAFTEEELSLTGEKGGNILKGRVGWARSYLSQAGLLQSPERGLWCITEDGTKALDSRVTLDVAFIRQCQPFIEHNERKKRKKSEIQKIVAQDDELTPTEQVEYAFITINDELSALLLQNILKASPGFFEKLVVELMLAMGYGGSRKDAGRATKYTQDGGIDGVIKEDKLGLETIYLQAKRYTDKTVGRPEIQSFAGALDGQRAKKGVFITTSKFSQDAVDYVANIEKRIVLIDAETLTNLMIEYNLGTSVKNVYKIKNIDSDYFVED